MTTILDSELRLVTNWNLKIVGLLAEAGSLTRFFFVVALGAQEAWID